MRVTLWDATSRVAEPFKVRTYTEGPGFVQALTDDGWQYAANGDNGSRVYMHHDLLSFYEVH